MEYRGHTIVLFIAIGLVLAVLAGCASDVRKDRSGFSALDHYNFGLNWLASNELQRAEVSFQRTLELDDSFGDAYTQLGLIYYILYERETNIGGNREAISKYYNQSYNCLRNGLKYNSKNPVAYTGIARLQIINRQFDGAVANLLKARELTTPDNISTDAVICYELGNCYLAQGRRQEALAEYKNYLQLIPDGAERANIENLIRELEEQLEKKPGK
ncbi:MAG: tetratricopeptide repeat protein [Planctomycetota bacterium]